MISPPRGAAPPQHGVVANGWEPNSDHLPAHIGPVRFAEKISRNTVPANLLGEKNTVPTKKIS